MRDCAGLIRIVLTGLAFSASVACEQRPPKSIPQQSQPISQISAASEEDSAAVRQFVQGFYDWYTAFVQTEPPFLDWWQVLSSGSQYLDANLANALRADSVAQRMDPAPREVIDFDPFLHSQDPCPRYEVTEVRSTGGRHRVTVQPVCPDSIAQYWQTLNKTTVVEVIRETGQWKIANVFYGVGSLKSLLCLSAKADSRPEKRPSKC